MTTMKTNFEKNNGKNKVTKVTDNVIEFINIKKDEIKKLRRMFGGVVIIISDGYAELIETNSNELCKYLTEQTKYYGRLVI